MKKNYIILSVMLTVSTGLFAQNRVAGTVQHHLTGKAISQKITPGVQSNGCDTVWNILANDTAVTYLVGGGHWGYVSGSNGYGDLAKAEKFLSGTYTSGYLLKAAVFFFAKAADGATPTTMHIKAWDNTGTGGLPGAQLGTTADQTVATMATGGGPTLITFPSPVTVTGDFYLGIDGFAYASPQEDTVVIYSNTNLPSHAGNAYDLYSDGTTWIAESDPANWSVKVDFYIIAILCSPTMGDVQIMNPTAEVIVYPNPSNGNLFVSTGVIKAGNVSIKVYDALGKLQAVNKQYSQNGGTYKVEMNGAAAGVYFMHITTADKTIIKKITIE